MCTKYVRNSLNDPSVQTNSNKVHLLKSKQSVYTHLKIRKMKISSFIMYLYIDIDFLF
jgi:hypothetical protein